MKINEIEQAVGITKKNIRFYEDQGLISPVRDPTNSYRMYSTSDVDLLLKIKLLRKLSVPIDDIRDLIQGRTALKDCLEENMKEMSSRIQNDQIVSRICSDLIGEGASFESLRTSDILSQMDSLEDKGVKFLNVGKSDVKKKSRAAVFAGVFMMALMTLFTVVILIASGNDPAPWPVYPVVIGVPLAVILGVCKALKERLNEINKGEEDEAGKY